MGLRYEVRLSGTGGQGVVLAGVILAEAADLFGGQHVVQTISYGSQVRGGMSNAELVVSEEEIDYPKPILLDLLVPFTPEACEEGARMMKPGGVILLDPDLVRGTLGGWVAAVPMTRLALETTNRAQMANIVALGAISTLAPFVDKASMRTAVTGRAPRGLKDAFLKALETGSLAVEEVKERIKYEMVPSPED
jgi:2-oxoglutarate ferredoxin oxidoreductase subunit gamma